MIIHVEIIEDYTKPGKYAIMECEIVDAVENAEVEFWVEFPIINYKNYAVYGENGRPLNIVDGDNHVVRVMLPLGYSKVVAVTYEIPLSYRVADVCSLIAVAAIAVIMLLFKKADGKKIQKQMKEEKGGD